MGGVGEGGLCIAVKGLLDDGVFDVGVVALDGDVPLVAAHVEGEAGPEGADEEHVDEADDVLLGGLVDVDGGTCKKLCTVSVSHGGVVDRAIKHDVPQTDTHIAFYTRAGPWEYTTTCLWGWWTGRTGTRMRAW